MRFFEHEPQMLLIYLYLQSGSSFKQVQLVNIGFVVVEAIDAIAPFSAKVCDEKEVAYGLGEVLATKDFS